MPTMLNLPDERAEQLRAIATVLQLPTMAATIGYLVRKEIAAGTIPAGLSGVSITSNDAKVSIAFGDRIPTTFTKANAVKLAGTIRDVARGNVGGVVDIGGNWIVQGKGAGVKVHIPAGTDPRIFSRDVALDLADLIEAAAE